MIFVYRKRRRKVITAVEGVDCAGKGEICVRLVNILPNAILYKTPPEQMRSKQDKINATATDQDHYRFFVQVVKTASKELAVLTKTCNVVVDRYWMTTVVYHRVMGINASLADMGDIVMPDLTIYLAVSPEEQVRRMNKRGMSPGDKRMGGRQNLIRRIYNEVIATTNNIIKIDTTNLTPEQVIDRILSENAIKNGVHRNLYA